VVSSLGCVSLLNSFYTHKVVKVFKLTYYSLQVKRVHHDWWLLQEDSNKVKT
jgi:hypothetical protein